MTGYEIIRRAVEFDNPPRIGIRFDEVGVNDTYIVTCGFGKDYDPGSPDEDEWGCIMERTDLPNMGQVRRHPIGTQDDMKGSRAIAYPDPMGCTAELSKFLF